MIELGGLVDFNGLQGFSWYGVSQSGPAAPVLSWDLVFVCFCPHIVLKSFQGFVCWVCFCCLSAALSHFIIIKRKAWLVDNPVLCYRRWGAAVRGLVGHWCLCALCCRQSDAMVIVVGDTNIHIFTSLSDKSWSIRLQRRHLMTELFLSRGITTRFKAIERNQQCLYSSEHSLLNMRQMTVTLPITCTRPDFCFLFLSHC